MNEEEEIVLNLIIDEKDEEIKKLSAENISLQYRCNQLYNQVENLKPYTTGMGFIPTFSPLQFTSTKVIVKPRRKKRPVSLGRF